MTRGSRPTGHWLP